MAGLTAVWSRRATQHSVKMRLCCACKYCVTSRQARPATPIYAFNILMRLAVTLSSDAAVANYYNIMRYARLADEAGAL